MDKKEKDIIKELRDAAIPFIDPNIVTETSGTIPLMERLESAIENIDKEVINK